MLLALGAVLYYLVFAPRPRPSVVTAGQVVFAAAPAAGGASRLWLAPAGGGAGRPRALTGGAGGDSSPTWTADGKQVAFLSNRAGGQNQIYLVDGDGQNLTQVTRAGGAKSLPSFAPGSNSLLGFLSGGTLAVAEADKGSVSLLLPAPAQSSHPTSSDPSVAQDSSSVVVSYAWKPSSGKPGLAATLENSGVQALALLPDLSSPPRLTQNDQPDGPPLAAADTVSTAWAPDGSKLAVALLRALGPPGQPKISGLFLFDADGKLQSRLFVMPPNSVTGPQSLVFSPDGSQIAFELWRQPDLASRARIGLFLVPASGGGPRVLVKGDAGAAQFSADGAQVFFLARRANGGHDLCRINTDGSGRTRLSDGKADVTGFALSPQGAKP